jgi:hypothetical protein
MRLAGRLCDRVGRYSRFELPLTEEGISYATRWVPLDDSRVERELGFQFRPLEASFAASISWLYKTGHISARQAGRDSGC